MKKSICALTAASMLAASVCALTVVAADNATIIGDNLLTNSGFESELAGEGSWTYTGTAGWYYDCTTTAERTSAYSHDGNYSLILNKANTCQRLTLTAGNTYRLTAYVKADASSSSPTIGFYDGTATYPATASYAVSTVSINATTEWQEVTADLECTSTQDYVICLMTWDDTTNIYFDDVTLYEIDIPYSSGGITNGDFSSDTDGWTFDDTSSKASVSDGVLSVSSTNGTARISQRITDVADGTYDLTATVTGTMPSVSDVSYLYAKAKGHTMARTAIPYYTSATELTVPGVTVDDGVLDIGLYASGTQAITLDNLKLTASDSTRVPFLKGGEISKLTYVEDKGGVFYDQNSTARDGLQIMAEQGFNLARIRVLNNPGPNNGNGSYYLPSGYQTVEDCLDMAKRAKDKGMQIEFTFAYSDWWTDGGEQYVPNDWESGASGLSGAALATYYAEQIYDFTKDVLQQLVAQGTTPDLVSIGNEMQYGMCFEAWGSNNGLYNNSTYIAQLSNAGAKAVREVCPNSKIVLHSDAGGKLLSARTSFINALSDIDFDVIAVSYYPFYDSSISIDTVVSEFASLINRFDKDVLIMETGYNWTELRGDGYEGQLENNGYYQDIYGETKVGQRAFLIELYAKLKQVLGGRCIGDLYWDPIMLYDGGKYQIGWAINSGGWTQGNVISNSTLFDFDCNALPAFDAMNYNTDANDKVLITGTVSGSNGSSIANTAVTVTVNGTEYSATTDAYGEYIVAVDYPETEKLSISAAGYSGSYYKDAPYDGILLDNIDFPTSDTAAPPVYNNDIKVIGTYDEGYIGTATALTFTVTPNDLLSGLFVKDTSGQKAEYDLSSDDTTTLTGSGRIMFGIVYPAIVNTDTFTVTAYGSVK